MGSGASGLTELWVDLVDVKDYLGLSFTDEHEYKFKSLAKGRGTEALTHKEMMEHFPELADEVTTQKFHEHLKKKHGDQHQHHHHHHYHYNHHHNSSNNKGVGGIKIIISGAPASGMYVFYNQNLTTIKDISKCEETKKNLEDFSKSIFLIYTMIMIILTIKYI